MKAIDHDNEFARAYAGIAIAYFFLGTTHNLFTVNYS
jgi:hypothetical protein